MKTFLLRLPPGALSGPGLSVPLTPPVRYTPLTAAPWVAVKQKHALPASGVQFRCPPPVLRIDIGWRRHLGGLVLKARTQPVAGSKRRSV